MSFGAPFRGSQGGQAVSQALSPIFTPLRQSMEQFQSSPQGQALAQAMSPIQSAIQQQFNQPQSQWMNSPSIGIGQSPVFNQLPFAQQSSVQQQPNSQIGIGSPWGTTK